MQETCLRPDIRYGKLSVPVSRSETASPAPLSDFILPPATNFQLDYTSPFICKIDLALLRPHPQPANGSLCSSPVPLTDQNNLLAVEVGDASGEISDQSHLTKVIVGVEEDGEGVGMLETPEEILMEVQEAAEAAKENLDVNFPGGVTTCFLNRGPEGKTMLNILNPHVNEGQWCPLAIFAGLPGSSFGYQYTASSQKLDLGKAVSLVCAGGLCVHVLQGSEALCACTSG